MAKQKKEILPEQSTHQVRTGLFSIIGLLILISVGLGGWYYYREQNWSAAFTQITDEKNALQTKLDAFQSNTYKGPYGVLSYVKYGQSQLVSSLNPESPIVKFPEAPCSGVTVLDKSSIASADFGTSSMLGGEVFLAMPETDQTSIKDLVASQLTFTKEGAEEKSSVYQLNKVCVIDPNHVLMLGVDSQNNAFRVPLWFSRNDNVWKLQAMPPTLNLFSATTAVRVHPDGNPVLFDSYQNANLSVWQAYYLDTNYLVIDTVESCRIAKKGGDFERACERLYDQAL